MNRTWELEIIHNASPEEFSLGSIEQIPPGEGREFLLDGEHIAVFHSRNGDIYATQALCPHRQGPLADGLMGGSVIVCPFHAHQFDMRDGQSLSGGCGLKTYSVRVDRQGELFLRR